MNGNTDNTLLIRIMILTAIIVMMMAVLIIRLWSLQVLSGREYTEQASKQYARNIRIPAVRGNIYSHDKVLLAGNRPSYEVLFHLSEMKLSGSRRKSISLILEEIKRCEKVSGCVSRVTAKDIEKHLIHSPGIPMKILTDISPAQLACIAEMIPKVQGMELSAEPYRYYPCRELAAHIIGYTGKRDPRTAEDRSEFFYYLPDSIGKTGLEKKYDKLLCGKPGKKLVIVNNRGFVHETVGEPQNAEKAGDLILTIDTRLQRKAEALLEGKYGVIILMDAETGAIRVMASSPGYDLNDFIPFISAKRYHYLSNIAGAPFVNKALQGCYMPGSIIKPLMSIVLQKNGLSPDEKVICDGATYIGQNFRIRCTAWLRGGHGPLDMQDALMVSCNDYFIEGGMHAGLEKIREVLLSAGLGQKTGIELNEASGLLPDRGRFPHWGIYDTALISIGQGKILVTPIQTVCYAAAIFNGGRLLRPYLVEEIDDPVKGRIKTQVHVRGQLSATDDQLTPVQNGMYAAVNDPNGGVKKARLDSMIVYGKSGTAEVGTRERHTKNTWFIGFCETPQKQKFAITVLVPNGISGNRTAGPLAAALLQTAVDLKQ